jgi:hypothetical protein
VTPEELHELFDGPEWRPFGPGLYAVGLVHVCGGNGLVQSSLADLDTRMVATADGRDTEPLAHRIIGVRDLPGPLRAPAEAYVRAAARHGHQVTIVQAWRLWPGRDGGDH